jgi:hypothetical protein
MPAAHPVADRITADRSEPVWLQSFRLLDLTRPQRGYGLRLPHSR